MNTIFVLSCLILTTAVTLQAAPKHLLSGSDTMAGVLTDAIVAAGMDQSIGYVGGGSGVGEKAFVAGEIGMAALSRPMNPELLQQMHAAGMTPIAHVVALDGLSIFVNSSNPLTGLDFSTLAKVFSCQYTSWNQIPGSGKTGPIKAFRRNDQSGTTDTFKSLVGLKKFGECVVVVNDTVDISENTANDADAIGYAGESANKSGNRALGVAKTGSQFVLPLTTTIRNGSYPLSRQLYIYEVSGARTPNAIEAQLLEQLLDRSFLDPIIQDHDFITLD